ncbi:MAG: 30S ribosomal protein S12 methylthiotransferase RimO [Christensenellaceae bacterium]|jgi:ribosomal protein S12 methylthiotransferase
MSAKIAVISLGCEKNTIDTEAMLAKLEGKYDFVQNMDEADVIIINTCAFITDAKEESINTVLEAEQLKRFHNLKGIIVTGCLPQRYETEFSKLVPRVDAFLGTAAYKDIEEAVEKVLRGETFFHYADQTLPKTAPERIVTTAPPTAYVKIAEGCDNHCSYCVIPQIRGPYQSRPKEDIIREIEQLAGLGYSEIVLIAQDTTYYGKDLYGRACLPELLGQAAQVPGVKWLRFLYSYPDGVTGELLDTVMAHDNIVKYIDMPIQHMDDDILKKMNRHTDSKMILDTVKKIRDTSDDFIIRSTVIVGFPGETREVAKESIKKLEVAAFDRLGVFRYSQEEGTSAAEFDDQVDEEEKEFREEALMARQAQVSLRQNEKRTGKIYDVLIEGKKTDSDGLYYGRSYAEAPDVDGKVLIRTKKELVPGKFYPVRIVRALNYDCVGELVE